MVTQGPATPNTSGVVHAEDRGEEPENSRLFPGSRNSEHYCLAVVRRGSAHGTRE